jgi:hypothetical protein
MSESIAWFKRPENNFYSHLTKVTRKCECFGHIVEPCAVSFVWFLYTSKTCHNNMVVCLQLTSVLVLWPKAPVSSSNQLSSCIHRPFTFHTLILSRTTGCSIPGMVLFQNCVWWYCMDSKIAALDRMKPNWVQIILGWSLSIIQDGYHGWLCNFFFSSIILSFCCSI